jgi:hypothetical protein
VCCKPFRAFRTPIDLPPISHPLDSLKFYQSWIQALGTSLLRRRIAYLDAPCSFFKDCETYLGFVPRFMAHAPSPRAAPMRRSSSTPRRSRGRGEYFPVDLSGREAAVDSMWRSLASTLGVTQRLSRTDDDISEALGTSRLSNELFRAAQRQLVFNYQVSLPHYKNKRFVEQAVSRCVTSGHFLLSELDL